MVQGELFPKRGGKREGAGRPRGPGRRRNWVRRRPKHSRLMPVHVTLRVVAEVGRLRRRKGYQAIRRALVTCLERTDFRIVHVSIQHNHVHLIVEADDARALGRGLQGFQISAARRLNAACGRQGTVFPERYHAQELGSPRQVRSAICYVLNNWRRHREDTAGAAQRRAILDPYASAVGFDGWTARFAVPAAYVPLPVMPPATWLLAIGWRQRGLIDPREMPGPT